MEYDELVKLLKNRTSCRSYSSEDVSEEDVSRIVDAGLWAPSGHNSQNVRVIRLKDANKREELRKRTAFLMGMGCDFDPFYGAKEVFIVVSCGNLASYDGSLVLGNMMLAYESLGLGCCWINTAQYETMYDGSVILGIVNGMSDDGIGSVVRGVGYLAVGHRNPHDVPVPKDRKPHRYYEI